MLGPHRKGLGRTRSRITIKARTVRPDQMLSVTTAEKQIAAIQAIKLQRAALHLVRFAYLDDEGAADLCDAAAKLDSATWLIRLVAAAVRRERSEQLKSPRREVA